MKHRLDISREQFKCEEGCDRGKKMGEKQQQQQNPTVLRKDLKQYRSLNQLSGLMWI